MSGFPDQPFNEHEQVCLVEPVRVRREIKYHRHDPMARKLTCYSLQRYFLAEIIKDSEIPPSELVTMIQQMKVIPRWTEIALPNGVYSFVLWKSTRRGSG